MKIAILLIAVNYHQEAVTARLIESVRRVAGSDLYLIVVDNECGQSTALSQYAGPGTRIVRSAENRYYLGAARLALEVFRADFGYLPQWVILSNNDIEMVQDDFFEVLKSIDRRTNHVVAPSIRSCRTGRDENPLIERPYTSLHLWYWRLFYSSFAVAWVLYLRRRLLDLLKPNPGSPGPQGRGAAGAPRPVYAPYGAFMIFSEHFFLRGGNFEGGFDLFHEELFIAQTARTRGMRVVYFPQLQVRHRGHHTIGGAFTRGKYDTARNSFRCIYRRLFSNAGSGGAF